MDFDLLGLVFGLFTLLALWFAWRASHSTNSKFNFEDLLLDSSGRTSLHKLGQFIALVTSTWGFVYLTLAYKLTEFYFGLYMAAWAGANAANKWLDQREKRDAQ